METRVPTPFRPYPLPEFQTHGVDPVASLVVHDGEATLRYLRVVNTTATAGFVQIHNTTSVPSESAKPLLSVPITANGEVTIDQPIYCSTGLVVLISTTLATKTISTNTALVFAKFAKH
jgi:hypothetical protein